MLCAMPEAKCASSSAASLALELEVRVVAAGHADVDAGGGPLEAVGSLAGVLERFPCHFEQQPLLRVHALCLARRDAEERRDRSDRSSRKKPP